MACCHSNPAALFHTGPASLACAAAVRSIRRKRNAKPRRRSENRSLLDPQFQALQSAYLNLRLACEASKGQQWASLDSHGVPFQSPLDVMALVDQCAARHVECDMHRVCMSHMHMRMHVTHALLANRLRVDATDNVPMIPGAALCADLDGKQ
jgi:hypothetical protein